MRNDEGTTGEDHAFPAAEDHRDAVTASPSDELEDEGFHDESLGDEVSALIDDGKTYLEAEVAFQKARASIAVKSAGKAGGQLAIAAILLHIALLALAVGLVIALQPLVTIWGAIAIVVGLLLIATGWLALKARRHIDRLGRLFDSSDAGGQQ